MATYTKITLALFAAAYLAACAQPEPAPMVTMEPEPTFTGKP